MNFAVSNLMLFNEGSYDFYKACKNHCQKVVD